MDVQEEAMGSSKHMIMKGKRAKRQRTVSPLELTMATSSSCSSAGEGIVSSSGFDRATTSPSNSGELVQSCIEEEDMANCLILLAQGQAQKSSSQSQQPVLVAMTSSSSKSIVDVYQCKTCNRCFPSFQALGGHRASHKKPKVTLEDKKPLFLRGGQQQEISTVRLTKVDDDATLSLQIPSSRDLCSSSNNKSRIHECSICGAEFTSGQALGGHMRRHRPLPTVTSTSSSNVDSRQKKPRTLLSLDLNLPAPEPEDDHGRESKYPFASKEQVIVFPASSLVNCHY